VKISPADVAEERGLLIEVEDNGKGIPEEHIIRLQEKVHELEPGDGSLGLWNVVRRCRLYYKAPVRMTFTDAVPQGTLITLRLPLPRNKAV
jgi:two-component system sensor histidine kinase YesM